MIQRMCTSERDSIAEHHGAVGEETITVERKQEGTGSQHEHYLIPMKRFVIDKYNTAYV